MTASRPPPAGRVPQATVGTLLTAPVMTVGMNQTVTEVRTALNRRQLRFAVVSQGGRITAVIDRLVLDRHLANRARRLLVRDVVHPGMACLRADAPAAAAARLMHITGSAAVPVVDEHHHLMGLVTADTLAGLGLRVPDDPGRSPG